MLDIGRSEKEKFIATLDEDDFREKIVRRLFKNLGYRDGRDTCGPEEFGKDAIFTELDKFGSENFTAVQTKRGNVNLAGNPNTNLHALIAQLRTALNQPHCCTRTKKKSLPLTVYLAASGTINQAARNYITTEVSDPRIRFLDRDDLISQIDEHCPEIWVGILADVSPYLKSLASRVEEFSVGLDSNLAHSSIGAFAAASDGRFIDIKLGSYEPTIVKRSGKIEERFDYKEISGTQLFSSNSIRALLLGDAGTGKTTLLIRLSYLIAKQSIHATDNYRVPIFLRAHELISNRPQAHFEVLAESVGKIQGINSLPFSIDDLEDGRITLLVDGLDELAEATDRQCALDFCTGFIDRYPKCSLALATRPYSSIEKLDGLKKLKRYRISPLSMSDASNMLARIESGKNSGAEWRKEVLRRLDGIHGIELNPLLVSVFAASTGAEKRDIPANITELFAKFTELMLGRWDEKKGMAQQYQSRVKELLLSEFAFRLQLRGESHFTRSDFTSFAQSRLNEMNLGADSEILVNEIIDRSGLLRGGDELEFRHHLLQEYFAGKGISELTFVKKVINDEWWRNSIVFYFGNQPKSVNDLLEVATDAATNAEASHVTIGLALQACYLSNLDDRIEVWKWVADGAALASAHELKHPDKTYPVTSFIARYIQGRDAVALGGIEKTATGIEKWAIQGNDTEHPELRRFWFAAALLELGEFAKLKEVLRNHPFESDLLATAIHFGCFFAASVRSFDRETKDQAESICGYLDTRVAMLRHQITKEFKGQLLEYRSGGVVALDAEEPRPEHSL